VISLDVEPLSPESFRPFGEVVSLPPEEPHATGPGWRWWAETALLRGDDRPWGVGYLDLQPAELLIDWAERHMRTQEAILATSADLLVYVGPPEHPTQPDRVPSLRSFRAFSVPAGSGVVLDRAVWHGAPFAPDRPTAAVVLILEGTPREDVTVVRFPETPLELQATHLSSPDQGADSHG
jgi:ureidoglycolate lyase